MSVTSHSSAARLPRRALLGWVALVAARAAGAQTVATGGSARPLRIVVPFPPGGASDTTARTTGARVGELLGQPVVVENRPGAGGNIATVAVTRAPADGQQVLLGAAYLAVNPSLYRDAGYEPRRDLAIVGRLVESRLVVVGRPDAGGLAELVDRARATRTPIRLASAGTGPLSHLVGVSMLQRLGVEAVHVPYRGSSPALTDLAGGQVDLMVDATASAAALVAASRVRALAVPESTRNPLFPGVPTLAELGVPDIDVRAWNAFFVRSGTPPDALAALRRAFEQAMSEPAVIDALRAKGLEVGAALEPARFDARLASESALWKRTIDDARITVD